jgi:hypothetical protein
MATSIDMTQVNGWFKTSYADKIVDLTPDTVYYAREAKPLDAELQPGLGYSVPVTLTSEQGVTKASSAAGAFALNSPVAMSAVQTSIVGSQLLLRSALDYETIFRSKNKNSFIAATKGAVENMLKSAFFYLEADIMWGKSGIGAVSSINSNTITLTAASFAPGLWFGSEGRLLRIESSAGVLRGTATVSSYDIDAKTVTVDSAPGGVVATDVIFFSADGATGANCMTGLHSAIGTTSGLLWGINRSTYGLWRPSTAYDCGNAPLSFNKIMGAITRASNHGLGSDISDVEVVVNPSAFRDMANDMAALRRLDSDYKSEEASNGSEKLTFYCPVGKVSVVTHKLMKEGFAFVHPAASKSLEIVGAAPKPTFELPGMVSNGEKQYLRSLENNAGVETRVYWNASVFTSKINQMILMTGIVNAA